MTTVYRVDVYPTLTTEGLLWWQKTGERHDLPSGGRTVIDTNGGQPADGWHESRRDAYLEAVVYVQGIVQKLHDQVDRFMCEAAR